MAGVLLAMAVALLGAAPAQAVKVYGGGPYAYAGPGIHAEPGEVNTITVNPLPPDLSANYSRATDRRPGLYLIRDKTAVITETNEYCTRGADLHQVVCRIEIGWDGYTITASLGDRNDSIRVFSNGLNAFLDVDGGTGDDFIENQTDLGGFVFGGAGNDHLILRGDGGGNAHMPSATHIGGGAGDDILDVRDGGPRGADISCSDGYDVLYADEGAEVGTSGCEEFHLSQPGLPVLPLP